LPSAGSAGRCRHLLVVEDSAIIAMDLEMSLNELGFDQVTVVPDAFKAIEVLAAGGIDSALVDFMLGNGDGGIVADRLVELDIPFAIMTGLGDLDWLRERVPGAPVLTKPFSNADLAAMLEKLCRG
jgi:CheY-like chemotaxis protein